MATVEILGVRKVFGGKEVLSAIDLAMSEGELICLLGPSGCGKTTLLRIIAGFIGADQGQVVVAGKDVTRLTPAERQMGMVFQSYSLFPNMTAMENVKFGPRVAGKPKAEQDSRALELLDLVGLSQHAAKYPHQLSGGQQQRVALARALAVQPKVLLLDEPLSALDAKVRVQLRDEIRRIQRETGVTTVLVTHDQEEALSISDRVAVMNAGRLLQVASPAAIYRDPADGFVARFIGSGAVLPGVAEGQAVRMGSLLLPAWAASHHAHGAKVEMLLRPEVVTFTALEGEVPAGGVAGEVRESVFLGALTRLRMTVAAMPEVSIWSDLPSEEAEALTIGRCVVASWDPARPRVVAA
jgi:putative spermidine/putrescine transport system ATP-binding protein